MFDLHIQKKIFWFVKEGPASFKTYLLLFILILLRTSLSFALDEIVTEQNIKDAILGNQTFTSEQLQKMDVNRDNFLDVSDLIRFMRMVEVGFSDATSDTEETAGTRNIVLAFSRPFTGTVNYTIGGTADSTSDFATLPGSVSVTAGSSSVSIPVALRSDTEFEGAETISLSLLPSASYTLGQNRTHTMTVRDNPAQTSVDYIFILGAQTPGVDGNTARGTGFPGTLFARKANVSIMFSGNGIQSATLNAASSTGLGCDAGRTAIPATTASYSGNVLQMVFECDSTSDSFVSDSVITTFNADSPVTTSAGSLKTMTHLLTLTVNDFDIANQKFVASAILNGTFSLSVSGVFSERTKQFFSGILVATMQQ